MILPYSIYKFNIKNFQGIIESSLEGLPENSPWIFITGKNGYGKTSLLRALAIGLYGDIDKADDERRLAGKESLVELQVRIINKDGLSTKRRWVAQAGEYSKHNIPVLAYGPVRIPSEKQIKTTNSNVKSLFFADGDILNDFELELVNLFQNESKADLEWRNDVMNDYNNATSSLLSFNAKFKSEENKDSKLDIIIDKLNKIKTKDNFVADFLNQHQEIFTKKEFSFEDIYALQETYAKFSDIANKLPLYDAINCFLLELMDNIKEIRVENNRLVFFEKEQAKEAKFINQLASGNRMLFTWVGDMLIRLNYRNFKTPKDIKAIVIIDELDLHLHPNWQKNLPCILSENLPNIQFVASTHSPLPILGAPQNSVFLKVSRTEEKGIYVERWEDIEIEIDHLLPNSILSSPMFELRELFPNRHDRNKKIRTEDNYTEIKKRDRIKKELKDREGSELDKKLKSFIQKRRNEKK
ncbi:MAG: AAA family ATPase [Marinifilaceae bacterium]|jgi:predicted ATP-binding protein involved in virulence|nr:AAA family ATPase [Marinifilaceae bacterium]